MSQPQADIVTQAVPPATPGEPPRLRRLQLATSLALLATVGGIWLALDVLARRHQEAFVANAQAQWKRINGRYYHTAGLHDTVDYVMLEDLPRGRYDLGGAYYIGGSNMMTAVNPWVLDPPIRQLVHNWALPGANHQQQFLFLRYMVEQEGILRAGGDKNLVVLGACYGLAADVSQNENKRVLSSSFAKQGLYDFDLDSGLRRIQCHPLERWLRIEKFRCAVFVRRMLARAGLMKDRTLEGFAPALPPDGETYRKYWIDYMGPDWQANMDRQVEILREMIRYLRQRGVHMVVVQTPVAGWHKGLPYVEAYAERLHRVCGEEEVRLMDLSGLLNDTHWADSSHPNYAGSVLLHDRIIPLATDHLRRLGLIDDAQARRCLLGQGQSP
ncbi:MAG: hypothetical protein BWX88_02925 [Planctomycetes bacterium ADurb.Bin126]|nr:MAG: hypothetical protein BWX88_02925 [Planctomycetes bacterium ADurb.Bin126]HOD80627.1 SGNH/GDSL hydrolase family protein [Phycisphaerae bacterium]HQL74102.1 SGNH/GDSL hydrolase family protein [Phycisphaerae bacterium]